MDEEVETIPGRKFRSIDLLVVGLRLGEYLARDLGEVCESFESAFETLKQLACQHANYLVDQEEVREQMARELETILENPNG
jgi:hypothetical protein